MTKIKKVKQEDLATLPFTSFSGTDICVYYGEPKASHGLKVRARSVQSISFSSRKQTWWDKLMRRPAICGTIITCHSEFNFIAELLKTRKRKVYLNIDIEESNKNFRNFFYELKKVKLLTLNTGVSIDDTSSEVQISFSAKTLNIELAKD